MSCGIVGTTTSHTWCRHSSIPPTRASTSWLCSAVLGMALLLMGSLAFGQPAAGSESENTLSPTPESIRLVVTGHPVIGQPTKVIVAALDGSGSVIKDYDGIIKLSVKNNSAIIPYRVDFSKKQYAVNEIRGVKSVPVTFTESGIVYVSAVTQIGSQQLAASTPVRVRQSANDARAVSWGMAVEGTFENDDENLARDEFMRSAHDEHGLSFLVFEDSGLVLLDEQEAEKVGTDVEFVNSMALALPDGVPPSMMNSDEKMPYTFRGGLVAVESGHWYTTTGARIILDFEITTEPQSPESLTAQDIKISGQVHGTAPLMRLDIFRRDFRKSRRKRKFSDSLVFTNSPGVMSTGVEFRERSPSSDSFYWVRAVQSDGHIVSGVLVLPK